MVVSVADTLAPSSEKAFGKGRGVGPIFVDKQKARLHERSRASSASYTS